MTRLGRVGAWLLGARRAGQRAEGVPASPACAKSCLCVIFFKDFIYLLMRDTERDRQREKQAPCREPDM